MAKVFKYLLEHPDILSMMGAVVVSIGTALYSLITKYGSIKLKAKATKIAEAVEQIYKTATSDEKLEAFKDLCKAQHVNVKKAVEYLEKYIIPTTNNINVVKITKNDDEIGGIM